MRRLLFLSCCVGAASPALAADVVAAADHLVVTATRIATPRSRKCSPR